MPVCQHGHCLDPFDSRVSGDGPSERRQSNQPRASLSILLSTGLGHLFLFAGLPRLFRLGIAGIGPLGRPWSCADQWVNEFHRTPAVDAEAASGPWSGGENGAFATLADHDLRPFSEPGLRDDDGMGLRIADTRARGGADVEEVDQGAIGRGGHAQITERAGR